MYLRRNRVRCGDSHRHYLAIAHNVWWKGQSKPGVRRPAAQSRPVVLASFGAEDKVDVEIARELVAIIERVSPALPDRRGELREATLRLAREVRRIEPFLKLLASKASGLRDQLPPAPERSSLLEGLVRRKLADPSGDPVALDLSPGAGVSGIDCGPMSRAAAPG